MITDVTIYKKDTGEIVQSSSFMCPDDPELIRLNVKGRLDVFGEETHASLLIPSDPERQYVAMMGDESVLINRPTIPYHIDKTVIFAGGSDIATITGLHDPCDIVIDDPDPLVETITTTISGGGFEFSAENAGIYTIQISKFPFVLMTLQIIAVNPQAPSTASFTSDFSYEFGV